MKKVLSRVYATIINNIDTVFGRDIVGYALICSFLFLFVFIFVGFETCTPRKSNVVKTHPCPSSNPCSLVGNVVAINYMH